MKKFFVVTATALTLTLASNAFATEKGAGCGLGKTIMAGKSGKNAHLMAAVIDWAVQSLIGIPFQWLGMTSGTLGCDTNQTVQNEQVRETFVASNMNDLSVDMARGEGQYLVSLADIMNIQSQDRDSFYSLTQSRYSELTAAADVAPKAVLASLDSAMLEDAALAKYVR